MLRRTLDARYKLILVESPNKVSNVTNYARKIADMSFGRADLKPHCTQPGEQVEVMATIGHFQQMSQVVLTESQKQDDQPRFQFDAIWTTTDQRKDHVGRIKSALEQHMKRGDLSEVILATDPDREGELISARALDAIVKSACGKKPGVFYSRAYMHSITQDGVAQALRERKANFVDENLAAAACSRHLLDRVFGFYGSRVVSSLNNTIRSVGRVQSPALILVHDRCKAHDDIIANRVSSYSFSGWTTVSKSKTAEGDKSELMMRCNVGIFHKILGDAAEASATAGGEEGGDDGKAKKSSSSAARVPVIAGNRQDADKCVAVLADFFSAKNKRRPKFECRVKTQEKQTQPPKPFTLQSLILECGRRLKMTSADVTEDCQALFVAGHITYPRTDSHRITDENLAKIRAAATEQFGADSVATLEEHAKREAKRNAKKSGEGNVEDAHEAIQPTRPTVQDPSDGMKTERMRQVYRIIRAGTLASVMVPKKIETASVTAAPSMQDPELYAACQRVVHEIVDICVPKDKQSGAETSRIYLTFGARRVIDAGFEKALAPVYQQIQQQQPRARAADANNADDEGADLDDAAAGAGGNDAHNEDAFAAVQKLQDKTVKLEDVTATERQPTPPPLFIEGTLIEELKRHGVGRPSTYSSIMKTLHERGYITASGSRKTLRVTETGEQAVALCKRVFPSFVSLGFTSSMEAELDRITEGEVPVSAPVSRCLVELNECVRMLCAESFRAAAELTPEEKARAADRIPPFKPQIALDAGAKMPVADKTDFDRVLWALRDYMRSNHRGGIEKKFSADQKYPYPRHSKSRDSSSSAPPAAARAAAEEAAPAAEAPAPAAEEKAPAKKSSPAPAPASKKSGRPSGKSSNNSSNSAAVQPGLKMPKFRSKA